jgi:hypothetical protein
MRKLFSILFISAVSVLSSCNTWLDVKPKTQIEATLNFSNPQGFKDALTGVYLNMSEVKSYGKDLTFGLVDVLAGHYTQLWETNQEYYQASQHAYGDQSAINKIQDVWTSSYFAIANLNSLLEALEEKDSTFFEPYVYNMIQGEALGLRAMHHFDLLRLFAPAPASKPMTTLSIPYRYSYGTELVAQSTIAQVIEKALADLDQAIVLLHRSDPIVVGTSVPTTTTGYQRNRNFKFNYYAALALKARIHLYAGQLEQAREAALEVVSSNKFPATSVSAISGGNRIFSTEVIFNLHVTDIEVLSAAFFNTAIRATKTAAQWDEWYELSSGGSADYRYLYQIVASGANRLIVKYDATYNTNAASTKRVALFRLSEMLYILSESYMQSDPVQAVTYLNRARSNRNLQALSTSLSTTEIRSELIKEYQKEFLGEGQLFYLYKRMNLANLPFYQKVFNDEAYVLPLPDDEVTYGFIK